jgi:hypothetical protein
MNYGYLIAAFFGGWCGSVPLSVLIWWLLHGKRPPPPPPDPWRRDWVMMKVIGAVSGVIAAYIYSAAFTAPGGIPGRSVLEATVFSIIGFLGGRFASEVYGVANGKAG